MTIVELLISISIIIFLTFSVSANVSKLIDFGFSYYYFEAAVYSGMWKGQFTKDYVENTCIVQNGNFREYRNIGEGTLKGLQVNSFYWARSGTYELVKSDKITIEPILFEVSKGR